MTEPDYGSGWDAREDGDEGDPAAEREAAAALEAEQPRASPALRRRVRHRLRIAFHRRNLRRRSVLLLTSGSAVLALAAALALNAPQ